MFRYTVTCTFQSAAVAEQWVGWLRDEHLAEVIEAGAASAEVVRLDGAPVAYQVHYRFPDRAAFEHYEQAHAPTLRAAGLERFPLELGLAYARSSGEVVVDRGQCP